MTVSRIKMTQSGPEVSRLVMGVWRLADWQMNDSARLRFIEEVMALGLTTFDHADIYGDYTCEALFGQALSHRPSLREKMELVTKCGIKLVSSNRPGHNLKSYDTSKAHIIASAETSLKNLQTDYLDVLLIHRPDPLLNADEVAEAFTALRQSGKVLNFGVSNFTPFQLELLKSRLDFPLVTNQVEISVLNINTLHDGTLDQCQRLGITPMAWSPFGGGVLFNGDSKQARRLKATIAKIAEALGGATIDQVALAWLLKHPARILPLLGSGKVARLKNAIQAESLTLTREQWFAIWSASTGSEVP